MESNASGNTNDKVSEAFSVGLFVGLGMLCIGILAVIISCAVALPRMIKSRREMKRDAGEKNHDLEAGMVELGTIETTASNGAVGAPNRSRGNALFDAHYQAYTSFAQKGAQPPPKKPSRAWVPTGTRHSVDF